MTLSHPYSGEGAVGEQRFALPRFADGPGAECLVIVRPA